LPPAVQTVFCRRTETSPACASADEHRLDGEDARGHRVHAGQRYCALPQGELHHVSTVHIRRPRSQMRQYGAKSAALALSVLALAFVALQGPRRSELESEGMKEYNLAKAKALLASDEVEVRNSKRRLDLIKDKLNGEQEIEADSGMEQEGLSNLLLNKAEDYELEADVSAAKVAKVKLHKKSLPKLAKEQASVNEEDDKLYARALRRAAERDSPTNHHLENMHLYLQQYGSKTSLKVGKAKEEYFLHQAQTRMTQDRKHLELMLTKNAKKSAHPATKVCSSPREVS
jgi:hypothetical protein